MIFKILFWTLGIIFLLVSATFLVDYIISAPGYNGPASDHFNGSTFRNLNNVKARGLNDVVRWAFTGDPGEWERLTEEDVSFGTPQNPPAKEAGSTITFVNHATFLIQVGGLNILTDPIWSNRASPFTWIGPRRMRPPGVKFEDLPSIDLVLISHNHYDHLDLPTLQMLHRRFNLLVITPLGVSNYLQQHNLNHVRELDWWQKQKINDEVTIHTVPAQHFSGRGLTDRDRTHWCGYVIRTPSGSIYFAGDTGYDGFFKKIGERFLPVKRALIPIGAYRPRWFMKPIHVNPEEAVRIHKDVKAQKSIGMHFGTFPLGDDGMKEPAADLASARKKFGVSEKSFIILNEGEADTVSNQARGTVQ